MWYGGVARGVAGEGLRSVGAASTSPIQERILYPARRSPFMGRGYRLPERTLALRRSKKFTPRVDLLLYNRLCRLGAGYGVRMSMHYLPGTLLGSIDHRNPKSDRSDVPLPPALPSARSSHKV